MLLTALLILNIASCRDFLYPTSPSEFTPSTVYQLDEVIVRAYLEPSTHSGHHNWFTGGFLDILSDDVETSDRWFPVTNPVTDTWYTHFTVAPILAMYTWQPDYSERMEAGGWLNADRIYETVFRRLVYVNSVLDYIDVVSGSEARREFVRAQALALRAFYYFHLVNLYGMPYNVDPDGLGVPIRTTGARENRPMPRNTVREVYALIVSDLTTAVELFESLPPHFQFTHHRANLPMAKLLLSRVYLYMENWEQAAHYSSRVINEWGHRFRIRNLRQITVSNVHPNAATATGEDAPQIRRAQRFDPYFLTYDNPDVIWLFNSATDMTRLTAQNFTQPNPIVQRNNTRAHLTLASRDLINTFDANDLRLRTYFVRSLAHEPDYATAPFNPALLRFRAFGKLLIHEHNPDGFPNLQGNQFSPQSDSRAFGQSLRFTEAFLILAEAQAMLGQAAQALETLGHIWRYRFADGVAPASYTQGDIVQVVRNERRRELALEALRWFDLRRWGQPRIERVWIDPANGVPRTFVLEENDPGYTLPLPHGILNRNPHLVQVPMYRGGAPREAR